MKEKVRIGLEVHIYPKTKSKLFCTCSSTPNKERNTNICPICTGQPGSKPMGINIAVLDSAIKLALALKFNLNKTLIMQRKHYFYPDLPNNYQRTSKPLGTRGKLSHVKLSEIHIEEDAGRYDLKKGEVDYNRSGVPLIELVTEPCIETAENAKSFLVTLKDLLRYLGIISGENIFKVDTNISVGGNRVEIKNINSIKNVKKVLEYEIKRQKELIKEGKEIKRETRHFDEIKQKTILLREKETAEDYRYMEDPDIPRYNLKALIKEIRKIMPQDLFELRKEFMERYGLNKEMSRFLTSDKKTIEWFQHLSEKIEPSFVASWMKKVLKGELNYRRISLNQCPLRLRDVENLLLKEYSGKITPHKSVELLRKMLDKKTSVQKIGEPKVSEVEINRAADSILKKHRKVVEKYLKGKKTVFNFLLGELNKKLEFSVPVEKLSKKLKEKLKS